MIKTMFRWFVGLAVVVALVFGVIFLVNITADNKIAKFSVSNGGILYLPNTDNTVDVSVGQVYFFNCNYTMTSNDFDVYVVPTANKDFEFAVDGRVNNFSAETYLTSGFQLEKNTTGFALYLPVGTTVQSIMQKNYVGCSVDVPANVKLDSYFTLLVVPKNAEIVKIVLKFVEVTT